MMIWRGVTVGVVFTYLGQMLGPFMVPATQQAYRPQSFGAIIVSVIRVEDFQALASKLTRLAFPQYSVSGDRAFYLRNRGPLCKRAASCWASGISAWHQRPDGTISSAQAHFRRCPFCGRTKPIH